jgi:hypothetical protein
VCVQDPKRAVWVTTAASVEAVVLSDGTYGWTDPLAATVSLKDRGAASKIPAAARKTLSGQSRVRAVTGYVPKTEPVVTGVASEGMDGVYCDSYGCATTEAAMPEERAAATPPDAQPPAAPSLLAASLVSPRSASWAEVCDGKGIDIPKYVEVGREVRKIMATIGTAYPVGGDEAWMERTRGEESSTRWTASLGIAYKEVGSADFTAGGEKNMQRKVGFEWAPSKRARSFLVEVAYQRVETWYCHRASAWGDSAEGTARLRSEEWRPAYYTGSNWDVFGIARPDWNGEYRCGRQSKGKFTMSDSEWRAYSHSTGVHAKDVIGIDLSIVRRYNTQAILVYDLKKRGRYLCGNDRPPEHAGKIMERPVVSDAS